MEPSVIGKVTATENKPTTYNTIRFWIKEGEEVKLFDVIRIKHIKESYTYAIIRDMQYLTDSNGHLANYVSSDFGDVESEPYNKRLGLTVAEAEVLYNTKGIEMPIRDNAVVETADEEGVREALGLNKLDKPIPAGYINFSYGTEVKIELESSYLLGPEGAHFNIAGISGLATKTSYAMFLLNAIQQQNNDNTAIILFNVKSNDLLAIDEESKKPLTETQKEEWRKCGLEPKPFKNVRYLYPFSEKARDNCFTFSRNKKENIEEQINSGKASNYCYDILSFLKNMDSLFSDVDDHSSTMSDIFNRLKNDYTKTDQDVIESTISDWHQFRKQISQKTGTGRQDNITVQSWRKFNRLFHSRTSSPLFSQIGITETESKRQILIEDAVKKLKGGEVLVVDIEPLPEYIQRLVVGDIFSTIHRIRLSNEEDSHLADPEKKIIVFADELNKYAPKSSGQGYALTENLLEITERGRSMGVILFGAEQFRSGVHDRILGNGGTNCYGRTSPVEIAKCPDYKYFSGAHKSTITRLEKGSLLLQHPIFNTDLIKVKFPFPCYRKEDI